MAPGAKRREFETRMWGSAGDSCRAPQLMSVSVVRALAPLSVLVLLCVLGTCVTSNFEPIGLGDLADAGSDADAGGSSADGGSDAGAVWRVRTRDVLTGTGFVGGNLWALGPSGATAGDAWLSFGSADSYVWLANGDGGSASQWKIVEGGIARITALRSDESYCGGALWPNNPPPGTTGTAIVGRGGSVERLLPDPITSSCDDANEQGTAIGLWSRQAYVRWPDAGVVSFDFYNYPDGGLSGSITLTARGLNERNEVVGLMPAGAHLGFTNPSGFVWSPDAGPKLLRSRQSFGRCWANDINGSGVIVGAAEDFSGVTVGAIWPDRDDAGIFLEHPPSLDFAEARAINDDGLIVGYGTDPGGASHGLVWWKGRVYFADELVQSDAQIHVDRLDFVNNSGRMAGVRREEVYGADGGLVARPTFPITIDVLALP